MPVTLIAGERDTKFTALADEMARLIPDATVMIVPGAGHAVHLERPDAVVEILLAMTRTVPVDYASTRRAREPRTGGHLHVPTDRRERVGAVEPAQRRQPAVPVRLHDRGRVQRRRDPERTVERRGDVDLVAELPRSPRFSR